MGTKKSDGTSARPADANHRRLIDFVVGSVAHALAARTILHPQILFRRPSSTPASPQTQQCCRLSIGSLSQKPKPPRGCPQSSLAACMRHRYRMLRCRSKTVEGSKGRQAERALRSGSVQRRWLFRVHDSTSAQLRRQASGSCRTASTPPPSLAADAQIFRAAWMH
ncbi:hypothetical protein BESB_035660 [Besnoitia besnoiti]|uniref:Uncharacterized protein n=1 Tax=Besnoitia besnoiti TaxID=94643 RepID=A0A2A9MF18_BESBE|nr:hypothetical protein BESB_035660 [Besnoitia besnoiti]PFH37108.1 hypothetical protein BESB_035660 [Besnoitia besnoiti]